MNIDNWGVYIRINEQGNIAEIGSDAFIADLTDWIKIDEGIGDKYLHAQNHYLGAPLYTDDYILQWKWTGLKVKMRTGKDIGAERAKRLVQSS